MTLGSQVARQDPPAAVGSVVRLRGARLAYGERVLWDGLDLDVRPGEFLAVLGPNGSGKTTLLRVLLGLQPLTAGTVEVGGHPPRRRRLSPASRPRRRWLGPASRPRRRWLGPASRPRGGSARVGYVPQQRGGDPALTLRGRDLVGLGLDGHRWGLGLRGRAERRERVAAALRSVGALGYADAPVGLLSGGELQRLRVAQALVGDPEVLLCDEPLLSLDPAHQRTVCELVDRRRQEHATAVLFVTHQINPVLPLADRVLYLVDGRFRVGTPEQVMTSETLSQLYRADVDVVRVRDRVLVVGTEDHARCEGEP